MRQKCNLPWNRERSKRKYTSVFQGAVSEGMLPKRAFCPPSFRSYLWRGLYEYRTDEVVHESKAQSFIFSKELTVYEKTHIPEM